MSHKKLRRDRIKLVIACTLLIALVFAASAVAADSTLRFVLMEGISRIGTEKIELICEDISTTATTLDDLRSDSRVTFDESMLLINEDNLLNNDEEHDIVEYKDSGVLMNSCVTSAYENLSKAVSGLFDEKLYISSSYRTTLEQIYQKEVEGDKAQSVGASEHQAGLALDVYVKYYAGYGFLKSEAGRWVNRNCHSYGFIIRYPSSGERVTGIAFEPWHLRYVGFPHSEIISKNALTLEEYMAGFECGKFYSADTETGSWLISRQSADNLKVPENFAFCNISPDNSGNYILTFSV